MSLDLFEYFEWALYIWMFVVFVLLYDIAVTLIKINRRLWEIQKDL